MRYFKFKEKFDAFDGITYLELEEGYALRQISKIGDRYIASNRQDDEYDFCLTEGYVNICELDADVIEVSNLEFEQVWTLYCKRLSAEWVEVKLKFTIGKEFEGTIKVFYPQGVIICLNEMVIGVANYEECKNSTTQDKMYPNHTVKAVIDSYDEKNMWLVLREARITD